MTGLPWYYLILVTYILIAQESMRRLNGLFVFWVKVGRIIPWSLKSNYRVSLQIWDTYVVTC